MTKPTFLLDVDGVCADFCSAFLDAALRVTGKRFTEDDVEDYDFRSLGLSQVEEEMVFDAMKEPGLCSKILPYEGTTWGTDRLAEMCDLHVVTSPFESKTWCSERERWIHLYIGEDRHNVTFTHRKRDIRGDFLLDDKASTVRAWAKKNPMGVAMLWHRPWNWEGGYPGVLVSTWDQVIEVVESKLGER